MQFHLPIILVLAIVIGIAFPAPGLFLSDTIFTKFCVFMIFIISGLRLDISSVKEAMKYWIHFIAGVIFILIVTPVAGYFVLKIPLEPEELKIGIAVMCCAPTVLASSAILADQCGGSFPLALLLSVGTNLLGVFISPLSVSILFRSSGFKVQLDVTSLLIELLLTIALPMVIGYTLQATIPAVAKFVKKASNILKVLSSLFLCMVPWVKMSASRDRLLSLDLLSLLYSLILIFVVHYIFLILTYLLCLVTKTPLPAMKALTLTCSMKTLPIAMTIISFLPESMGSQGILLVPAILFHFFQLLNCSFITVKWTPKEVEKKPEGKKEMKVKMEEPHVIPSKTTHPENDHYSVC
ncbi:putative sodium metabolite cotransporter chloroplastic [Blastocystis sp. subtype 4]|uniref:putative sodium metabolite cotransporter chloroplastic n=1 Tax=Blastocystis sp. subtype 4 TaxID=944170 RepID=UPI000711D4FA|nr:putative sodium metabolite cotransporter chloroplastic [Blastocystis sp. subtype 4]KNB44142.1 putative sodium metabolite cotransporter chloroplastic [Blastocystis sp. subtype 4]|eukprot:XP_014527581.1 putative sodium metabolite cotransporter chloroplastic [Blastocystis sp. subtype 4]